MASSNGRKRLRLVCDFETTTDPDDCRVWSWFQCNIDNLDDVTHGTDMQSFIDHISTVNATVYFHNLAFDGSFILDYLLINGFHHTDGPVRKNHFATLISSMGKYYSITVRWQNGHKTEFRDSLKKLPMSVKNIARAFHLDEDKLTLDYHAPRPIGYQPTPEEIAYGTNDVVIVAKALAKQFSTGMTRLTVGSDSLAEFKKVCGPKLFDHLFPVLPETMDAQIRQAYRGGFTYCDTRTQGTIVGAGRVFDVNSLYPSVMYDQPMPYGHPIYFDGAPNSTDEYPLYVVTLTFTATLKPDHIPCIQVKSNPYFVDTFYQTDITQPVTMTCTSVDLALWQNHYNIEILAWEGGWSFKAITGAFTDYIDKWMAVKNVHEGGLRAIAKLMLNSLYGKFATNPNVTPKIPVLDDNGILKLVMGDDETRDPVYTAVGVFITAYARDITIRAAQDHYDVFLYADTDSLHLLDKPTPTLLDVDPHRLGAWKVENTFGSAIYVRAKCYCEKLLDGSYVTHIAGLPEFAASQVTFADFHNGKVFTGKLLPVHVHGGIVLEDVGFTLNMQTHISPTSQ